HLVDLEGDLAQGGTGELGTRCGSEDHGISFERVVNGKHDRMTVHDDGETPKAMRCQQLQALTDRKLFVHAVTGCHGSSLPYPAPGCPRLLPDRPGGDDTRRLWRLSAPWPVRCPQRSWSSSTLTGGRPTTYPSDKYT